MTEKTPVFANESSVLQLVNSESDSITESLALIEEISKKHGVDIGHITEILEHKDKYIVLPVGLFRSKLGPLEAVVGYMKEVLDLNLSQIARLLNRDETTIWTTYQNSWKKGKIIVDLELKDVDFGALKIKKENFVVPLSVFANRELSILEALCVYLRENHGLNYTMLGKLLERNERTIWTVVSRAKKKWTER
ncbi:hypothetical protein GOV09_05715 [Candidatus Woesearchaeota archaeon]|nr:hypothetical protein [Candidatus Woesearchaeota archaeon]